MKNNIQKLSYGQRRDRLKLFTSRICSSRIVNNRVTIDRINVQLCNPHEYLTNSQFSNTIKGAYVNHSIE